MTEEIAYRFVKDFQVECQSGKSLEEALSALRSSGATIVECIVAVREHTGCSLADAKSQVHTSKTWHDIAEAAEATWDKMIEELEKKRPNPTSELTS